MRIAVSAGYRIYYFCDGTNIYVVAYGGTKSNQEKDILKTEKKLAFINYRSRKKMAKKIKSEIFDAANFLDNEEVIAEYINIALESNDPNELLKALDTVARAKGMTRIAKETGLNRESLYKSLKEGNRPYFDTLQKVLSSIGIKFKAVPSAT